MPILLAHTLITFFDTFVINYEYFYNEALDLTIKYFLKLISTSCESIIFMFLGESLVQLNHNFNFAFVMFTLLFCTVFRAVGIATLTGLANRFGRLEKVSCVRVLILSALISTP